MGNTPVSLNENEVFSNHSAEQSPDKIYSESSEFSEKDQEVQTKDMHNQKIILISGGHQVGKCSTRHPKCEDAYFISENAFGLSDGVSGWNDYGFSSDEFSK